MRLGLGIKLGWRSASGGAADPFDPTELLTTDGFYIPITSDTAFEDAARTDPVDIDGDTILGATDLGSFGYHASSATGPLWRTDPLAEFSVTSSRLDTALTPASSFSMAARFRRSTSRATGTRVLMGSASGIQRCWLSLTGNVLSAGIGDTGSDSFQDTGATDLSDSEWHVAVVTTNGTTNLLYLDGVQVNTGGFTGTISPFDITLGARRTGTTTRDNFWQDDVSHWLAVQKVLTPEEITDLTNSWGTGSTPSGDALILEGGDSLLLESGDRILLE